MAVKPVVVIEDQEEIREGLREVLEMEGYSVKTAANGREGLKLLEDIGEPCIIILDIQMPVMNGWEFIEAYQKLEDIKKSIFQIIVISAFSEAAARAKKEVGEFLKKPVNLDSLLNTVKKYAV